MGSRPCRSPARSQGGHRPGDGAPGIAEYFAHSISAHAYDINVRVRDTGRPDIRESLSVHEIAVSAPPFTVHEDDRIRVTATLVHHPPVYPSFAFRFDTDCGSVVFSGDTAVSGNLIRLARSADVLVHEAIDSEHFRRRDIAPARLAHLVESHTDITEVDAVAQQSGVRTLVLSHLAPGDVTAVDDAHWRTRAQQGFDGEVIVGRDLMRIPIRSS